MYPPLLAPFVESAVNVPSVHLYPNCIVAAYVLLIELQLVLPAPVTVIVAVPTAFGTIVTVVPDTEHVAYEVLLLVHDKVP